MPDIAINPTHTPITDTLQEAAVVLAESIKQTREWREFVDAQKAAKADERFTRMVARHGEFARIHNNSTRGRGQGLDGKSLVEFIALQEQIRRHELCLRQQEAGSAVVRLLQSVNEKISQELGLDFATNAALRRGGCCGQVEQPVAKKTKRGRTNMNTPEKDEKHPHNMELLKQQASACGPGCGCHAAGASGKTRWVIGAIVLVAAGVMVVQAITKTKSREASTQAVAPAFADPIASQTAPGTGGPATDSAATTPVTETSVATTLGAFSELNTVAAKTDAVFIFVPGKEGASGNPPSTTMKAAVRTIESKAGLKCGLFTLKAGTSDYDQIVAQMSVPGVLAIVKGRGMSAVSGEVTESKLLQGFVAASSAGGCGSGGGGCGPASAGCR